MSPGQSINQISLLFAPPVPNQPESLQKKKEIKKFGTVKNATALLNKHNHEQKRRRKTKNNGIC